MKFKISSDNKTLAPAIASNKMQGARCTRGLPSEARSAALMAVLLIPVLTSCGWVDSASNGPASTFDTSNLVELFDGEISVLLEDSVTDTILRDSETTNQDWTWTETDTIDANACEQVDGYDSAFAERSLLAACTDTDECSIEIEKLSVGSSNGYRITTPRLKAPVALNFQLTATDALGLPVSRSQLFCALSINEAPALGDDELLVLKHEKRVSKSDDSDAILVNDTDDLDSRNLPLSIDLQSVQPPVYASEFLLEADGSFIYSVDESLLPEDQPTILDQFTYNVTDGVHSVQTTTRLRIVDENNAPDLNRPLGVGNITLDNSTNTGSFTLALNDYFNDADGDNLYYKLKENSLPDGLSGSISDTGLLTLNANASGIGQWLIVVNATDGLEARNASIYLVVEQAIRVINTPPTVIDIPPRTVTGTFSYPVRDFFTDPDGDELIYTGSTLPQGVQVTSDGILEGTAQDYNMGVWLIYVQASDGRGGFAYDWLLLTIQ